MNNTRHHEMSEIVGLEVKTIGKRAFLIFGSHLGANHGLILMESMSIDPAVALVNDHRCMDIPILPLRLDHLSDKLIHQGIKFGVFVDSIHSRHRLKPLVHIAVVERWPPMLSGTGAGSNLKVAETVRNVRIVPSVPHALKRSTAIYIKTLSPKSSGPFHSSERGIAHYSMPTAGSVSKSVRLR